MTPLATQLRLLSSHISKRRKRQLLLLLGLLLISSVVEIFSIGAVLPFLMAITAPEKLIQHPLLAPVLDRISIGTANELQVWLTAVFIFAVLLAGAVRILLAWVNLRLAYAIGADLSYDIYWRTLCQPYSVHVGRNSSQIVSVIVSKISTVIAGVVSPTLVLASSVFLLVNIFCVLFAFQPYVTVAASLIFGGAYLVIVRTTKALKLRNGKIVSESSTQVVKSIQEGIGGIRDILLDGSQKIHCDVYRKSDIPLRQAQGNLQFIAQSPRFLIEAVGMAFIAVVAFYLARQDEGFSTAIPVLGALAIGAQRMLPVMQQAYVSWSSITSARPVLDEVLDLLSQPILENSPETSVANVAFNDTIHLREVGFRYSEERPQILNKVNLEIKKGSRIGIIGPTGSGKSTFIDVLMGLLRPTHGDITVDGVKIDDENLLGWQRHIAHVPQSIFLTDSSIADNIAFGVPQNNIDLERVRLAAGLAQIAGDIERWPAGYDTRVGERGIRLSGGQRQRVGIARALYKRSDVILFDEATSALDTATEKAVMDAIDKLSSDLTIIIIAHRLSTLSGCDSIVEFAKDGVVRLRSYSAILETTALPKAGSICRAE